jgi:hypothetical protein
MDIGEQQRVIIVEVDSSLARPAPIEEPAPQRGAPEPVGAWPLPLDLDTEADPTWADQTT